MSRGKAWRDGKYITKFEGIIDCNADFVHEGTLPASCGVRTYTDFLPITSWVGDKLLRHHLACSDTAELHVGQEGMLFRWSRHSHVDTFRLRMYMTKLRHVWLKEGFRRRDKRSFSPFAVGGYCCVYTLVLHNFG